MIDKFRLVAFFIISFVIFYALPAFCWHDETHLAIAKAAGYKKWYNAMGADMAKIKAYKNEQNNHYFNNNKKREVTAGMVFEQIARYNNPGNNEGQLYGAIIASLREYKDTVLAGKYAEYHLGYCAHYIGDLSHQPLHNIPYDGFNKMVHTEADGVVEGEALGNIHLIQKNMYPVMLGPQSFEKDLAGEIARIAELSRQLGNILKMENRNMTRDEAYVQLGHSASLFKAILQYLGN